MTALLILSGIFASGFGAGYFVRARISNNRRKKYLMHASRLRGPDEQISTLP